MSETLKKAMARRAAIADAKIIVGLGSVPDSVDVIGVAQALIDIDEERMRIDLGDCSEAEMWLSANAPADVLDALRQYTWHMRAHHEKCAIRVSLVLSTIMGLRDIISGIAPELQNVIDEVDNDLENR